MPSPFRIARPPDLPALCAHLLRSGAFPGIAGAAELERELWQVWRRTGWSPLDHVVSVSGGGITASAAFFPAGTKGALLEAPRPPDPALVRGALEVLPDRFDYLQALADEAESAVLTAGGFPRVATLLLLSRARTDGDADLPEESGLVFRAGPLEEVLARTLKGSLDIPALQGELAPEEMLAAYRLPGEASPPLWFRAERGGEAVGCLLLTPSGGGDLDLKYVGVVPEARGRGLGRALVRKAVREAARGGFARLTVAVDEANASARRLYDREAFVSMDRRAFHFVSLSALKRPGGEAMIPPSMTAPAASSAPSPAPTPDELALLKRRAARLRRMSVLATTEAGSGHPTTCLSAADLVAALFFREMRLDVKKPGFAGNDRLILSKGHAAPLLYAAWAQLGVLKEEELLTLRRIDSPLEGHPTPNFSRSEAATGSLGQGLSIGVGFATANRLEGSPARTFVLLGDGEMAEGSVWEAASLAAVLKLGSLVAMVDVNGIGQSQRTARGHDTAWYAKVFESFGWRTVQVDGHDMAAVAKALSESRAQDPRPLAILARTLKGQGIASIADADGWHGKPVPKDKLDAFLAELGDDGKPLPAHAPQAPLPFPAKPRSAGTLDTPPPYKEGEKVATRNAYGAALARLGAADGRIVGLDGDTKNSTMSLDFMKAFPDRFVECFIAEQNLAGIAVGLGSRGFVPFASTFAAFLARAYDFIRMGAVGKANVKFCGSHCGVSIGEDGPSQMGLEDLAMFRAVPGAVVLYPSDAVSTEWLVREAARHDGLVYLRSTRPATAVLYPASERFRIGGSRVVRSSPQDKVTVVAAGVTLHEALAAKASCAFRVVDAYSVKPLDAVGIAKAVEETGGRLLVVEDHYPEGGLGEAVLAALQGKVKAFRHLCVKEMPRSGTPTQLLARHGIDAAAIGKAVSELAS